MPTRTTTPAPPVGYPRWSRCWFCGRFALKSQHTGARWCRSGHEMVKWVEPFTQLAAANDALMVARLTGQNSIRDRYHVRPVAFGLAADLVARLPDFSNFIDHGTVRLPAPA